MISNNFFLILIFSIITFLLMFSQKSRILPILFILFFSSIFFVMDNTFEIIKGILIFSISLCLFIYRYYPKSKTLKYISIIGIILNITYISIYEITSFEILDKINGLTGLLLGIYLIKFIRDKNIIGGGPNYDININNSLAYIIAYTIWDTIFVIYYLNSFYLPYILYALIYPVIFVVFIKKDISTYFSARAIALAFTFYLVVLADKLKLNSILNSFVFFKHSPMFLPIAQYKTYILGLIILINILIIMKYLLNKKFFT